MKYYTIVTNSIMIDKYVKFGKSIKRELNPKYFKNDLFHFQFRKHYYL